MFTFTVNKKSEKVRLEIKGIKGSVPVSEEDLEQLEKAIPQARKDLKLIRRDKARG